MRFRSPIAFDNNERTLAARVLRSTAEYIEARTDADANDAIDVEAGAAPEDTTNPNADSYSVRFPAAPNDEPEADDPESSEPQAFWSGLLPLTINEPPFRTVEGRRSITLAAPVAETVGFRHGRSIGVFNDPREGTLRFRRLPAYIDGPGATHETVECIDIGERVAIPVPFGMDAFANEDDRIGTLVVDEKGLSIEELDPESIETLQSRMHKQAPTAEADGGATVELTPDEPSPTEPVRRTVGIFTDRDQARFAVPPDVLDAMDASVGETLPYGMPLPGGGLDYAAEMADEMTLEHNPAIYAREPDRPDGWAWIGNPKLSNTLTAPTAYDLADGDEIDLLVESDGLLRLRPVGVEIDEAAIAERHD